MDHSINNFAKDERFVKEAYARAKADWAGLAEVELLRVNLDVQIAAETIVGSLGEMRRLREAMLKDLPSFDVARFDKLEEYVMALLFVQSRYLLATQSPDDLVELGAEATKLRERLVADAKALALRGLFEQRKLANLKGGQGYRNVAVDLQALATEFDVIWAEVQGRCGTTRADLDAATQMSMRLTRTVGVRDQSPAILGELIEERMRAFTLVIKTYDAARAAVSYLRQEQEDAESIAPNLYTGKAKRTRAAETEDETPRAPAAPVVATPSAAVAPAASEAGGVGKNGPFVS